MYHLLSDKESQKTHKFQFIDGKMIEGERTGFGVQDFENGCVYTGQYVEDRAHGKGKFTFPEGTVLEGFFEHNHFRHGMITLSVGIVIQGVTETDPDAMEDFLKDFSIKFKSGYVLKGSTTNKGFIENAMIFDRNNNVVARYRSGNLIHKVPEVPSTYIVVSKLWVYEGGIINNTPENSVSITFDGEGTQIWYSGIGYYKGHRINGVQDKIQLILRHSGSLQFFREITYNHGRLVSAVTVFNNGIIFMSKDDYFKGVLKVFLSNGNDKELKCNLSEYSILKSGSVLLEDEDVTVKFGLKNGRLMFTHKNKDYSFDDFKEFVLQDK